MWIHRGGSAPVSHLVWPLTVTLVIAVIAGTRIGCIMKPAVGGKLMDRQDGRPAGSVISTVNDWGESLRSLRSRDPANGSRLPLGSLVDSTGVERVPGASGRYCALLFIGSCTECATEQLLEWNRLQEEHRHVDIWVVAIEGRADLVDAFRLRHGLRTPFILGEGTNLERVCNPFFVPRVYLLDDRCRLLYVQDSYTPTRLAIAQIHKKIRELRRV